MRCLACNAVLTDYEATLKDQNTGEYLNECSDCVRGSTANYALEERIDLKTAQDIGLGVADYEVE